MMMKVQDLRKLKLGDYVYRVVQKNNVLSQKKITMTDAEGYIWHRYDRDRWDFYVEKLEYVGHVGYTVSGEVRFDEDRVEEFHFRHPNGSIWPEEVYDDYEWDRWFKDKAEAEETAEALKESKKE